MTAVGRGRSRQSSIKSNHSRCQYRFLCIDKLRPHHVIYDVTHSNDVVVMRRQREGDVIKATQRPQATVFIFSHFWKPRPLRARPLTTQWRSQVRWHQNAMNAVFNYKMQLRCVRAKIHPNKKISYRRETVLPGGDLKAKYAVHPRLIRKPIVDFPVSYTHLTLPTKRIV